MSLFFIVALPFFGALLPGLMNSAGRSACAGVTFTVSLAAFIGLLTNLPAVLAGEVVMARVDWMPSLGLNFTLMLDGSGLFLCLLDPWHRPFDHRLCAPLPEPRRQYGRVLHLSAAVSGRDGRHRSER